MDYPITDDDWVKLAECIVTKDIGVLPEAIGSLTVEATATIFSWYRGEERSEALGKRANARHDLTEYGRRAGCLEAPEPSFADYTAMEEMGHPIGRPSPQTYGDWVNLAEDIKSADPASWTAAWVNEALQHISEEDPAAEGSKRKLVQRASELGIK